MLKSKLYIELKSATLFLMAFGITVASGCLDRIDFEVSDEFKDALVIEGRIVKGEPSFVEVDISRLFDFSQKSREPVRVSKVMLIDEKGTNIELITRSPGHYRTELDKDSPINPQVGDGYKIRIETFDGRIIESDFDYITPNMGIDNLSLSEIEKLVISVDLGVQYIPNIELAIDTKVDPSTEGGVLWEVRSRFKVTDQGLLDSIIRTCYIDRITTVNEIYVLEPSLLRSSELKEFGLVSIPFTDEVKEGYFFEVRQYSLTPLAFRYWHGIDLLSERDGDVFDIPVGEVPSNFKNVEDPNEKVFGFFFASEEDLRRIEVPEIFTSRVDSLCPVGVDCTKPFSSLCFCLYCCDCRLAPGSSMDRPLFFD